MIFWPFSLLLGLIIQNWDAIKAFFGGIAQWFSEFFGAVWDTIVAIFTPVVEFYAGVFGAAWEGIKTIWNAVTGFFKGVWNGIVSIFNVVGGWFRSVFEGAWNAIESVFSPVYGFFKGVWNGIVGIFGSIGSAVSNAKRAVKGASKEGKTSVVIGDKEVKIENTNFAKIDFGKPTPTHELQPLTHDSATPDVCYNPKWFLDHKGCIGCSCAGICKCKDTSHTKGLITKMNRGIS